MSVKLLTEYQLEFLSLKWGCIGVSESTLVKMPHCWKSHVTAHMLLFTFPLYSIMALFIKCTFFTLLYRIKPYYLHGVSILYFIVTLKWTILRDKLFVSRQLRRRCWKYLLRERLCDWNKRYTLFNKQKKAICNCSLSSPYVPMPSCLVNLISKDTHLVFSIFWYALLQKSF